MNSTAPIASWTGEAFAGIERAFAHDWRGAIGVSAGILALFGGAELLRRFARVPTEYTRKLTHLGAGVIVLGFPWFLSSPWTVAILAVAFFGVLVLGRVTGLLSSVHDVERRTAGAYYYPFAVFGTFWLAHDDPLLYCAPVAVMAIADTGAAIVGRRPGNRRYRVMDGARTIEGSLTFFGLALGILLTAMALAGRPGWPAMLLVALVGAIVSTATEAICVRGIDNLFIPYATFMVLDRTLRLGLHDLSGWIEGMILSLAVVVLTWRRAGLTTAGGITAFLVGTIAWALGGPRWALPLLALYALFVATAPRGGHKGTDLDEVFPTTVGSMVVVLAFAHSDDTTLYLPYLATLAANGAIALGRLATARRWPPVPLILSGALAPVLPVLWFTPKVPVIPLTAAAMAGLTAFALLARTRFVGRRMVASLLAGALAWAMLPL